MGRKLRDLTGLAFGLLIVLHLVEPQNGRTQWLCRCSCGNEKPIQTESLVKGRTKSCGCATNRFIRTKREKQNSLINQRFGRLFVLWRSKSKKYGTQGRSRGMWECKCDCGNFTKVTTGSLRSGKTKSCGCLFREAVRLESGQAGFNIVFNRYKKYAEKRGLNWELTEEQFKSLTLGNCHYCGEPPKQISRRQSDNGAFAYNGVDRMNNLFGYISGNVVSCCGIHNQMKGTMSLDEFIRACIRVAEHKNRMSQSVGVSA